MTPFPLRPRLAVAVMALVVCAPVAAPAQESFEQGVIRGLLTGIGLIDEEKPPIDYRERAPLVVPPNAGVALPPPGGANRIEANPAWPRDQDVERRRAAERANANPFAGELQGSRRLSNEELRRGTIAANRDRDQTPLSVQNERTRAPLTPSEMGFTGWRSPNSGKPVEFTGEPERQRLTQPPAGLQTPSPNQPYGKVGDDKLEDNWLNRLFAPSKVADGRTSAGQAPDQAERSRR